MLMDALEQRARREKDLDVAKEARKFASEILQHNVNFRDIKTRVENLRQLVDELAAEA